MSTQSRGRRLEFHGIARPNTGHAGRSNVHGPPGHRLHDTRRHGSLSRGEVSGAEHDNAIRLDDALHPALITRDMLDRHTGRPTSPALSGSGVVDTGGSVDRRRAPLPPQFRAVPFRSPPPIRVQRDRQESQLITARRGPRRSTDRHWVWVRPTDLAESEIETPQNVGGSPTDHGEPRVRPTGLGEAGLRPTNHGGPGAARQSVQKNGGITTTGAPSHNAEQNRCTAAL